jgi:diguanylate cyclase (GGDEF)-like protein
MKMATMFAKKIGQALRGARAKLGLGSERKASVKVEASAVLRTNAFRAAIRSLDAAIVGRAAVSWLREDWRCDNAIWLKRGALAAELAYWSGGQNALSFVHGATRGQTQSAAPVLEGDFARIFSRWGLGAPSAEPREPGASVRRAGEDGRSDVILTLAAPDSGREILGHLILVGALAWEKTARSALFRAQLEAFADRMDQALAHEAVRELTFKDELTDLYNQRYLPLVLDQQVERALSGGSRFSVLFIDVDRFKLVNDENGHLVGSQLLVELSRLLRSSVRRTDFAFRYGGDEYVVVLPGADARGALAAAERIRKKAEISSFSLEKSLFGAAPGGPDNGGPATSRGKLSVTVSIGVAAFPEHALSTRELLRLADEAMYASKRQSRNAVRLAS